MGGCQKIYNVKFTRQVNKGIKGTIRGVDTKLTLGTTKILLKKQNRNLKRNKRDL